MYVAKTNIYSLKFLIAKQTTNSMWPYSRKCLGMRLHIHVHSTGIRTCKCTLDTLGECMYMYVSHMFMTECTLYIVYAFPTGIPCTCN